jgi:hypothetical protein
MPKLDKTKTLVLFVYLLFSLIMLRGIILSSDFIGFNHDWSFPMTINALKIYNQISLFIWKSENVGFNPIYPAENLLHYLLLPFTFLELSGLTVIKMILMFTLAFGGYFMYLFVRNSLKLKDIPSLISGLFYTTTPVVFNKIAAGHIPYIIAYALSPLIMFYFVKYTNTLKTKHLIITSLLLSFAIIQIQFAVMLALIIFLYAILIAEMKMRTFIKTFFLLTVIVLLTHLFWILPASVNSSALSATLSSIGGIDSLKHWITPFTNAFRMTGYASPHFETILNNYSYKYIWDICSSLLVIFSFSTLLIYKRRIILLFAAISVITLIFLTISNLFWPLIFFLYSTFPVFNLFREVYHLAFLMAFSYSVMLAFFLQSICTSKRLKTYLKYIVVSAILIIVIMNDPFIYSGNLSGQLQTYQPYDLDLNVINSYLNSSEDYRVLYLPMLQPFKYDNLTYYGINPIIAYSEKPTIGNYVYSDFLKHLALYSYLPSSNLTNVLNLLSVKYIFFQKNIESMVPSYLNQGQLQVGNEYYDIGPIWTNENINETLLNQKNLILLYSDESLSVFENKDFLPQIYPATILLAENGSMDNLFSLLLSSALGGLDDKAIFLSGQLDQEQWQFINEQNNTSTSSTPQIVFSEVNPTKYEVRIENATHPFFLVFGESYDSQWKAYIEDSGYSFNNIIASYPNVNVKEANSGMQFTPSDIQFSYSKPLDNKYHFEVNGYANAWYIDPAQINKNEDGSFIITLYYSPQSLFYLGLVISGATFIACMVYLVYDWKYKKE